MRTAAVVTLLVMAAGVALVAEAVARGAAEVSLVLIVPVVGGSSGEFLLGVVLLVAGIFALPWSLTGPLPEAPPTAPGREARSGAPASVGGLVLLGPVPIFFGSWGSASRRARWAVALLGAAVVGLLVTAWVLAGR